MTVHLYSAAKLNLTLRITGRRKDGYHELRSLFYALPSVESLTITPLYGHNVKEDDIAVKGEKVFGRNILSDVLAAARRLGDVPPLRIRLLKAIPPGSGLGGGSGNAGALISWISAHWEAPLMTGEETGSDVPFFVRKLPWAAVRGRGEEIEPLTAPLPSRIALVVIPRWKVSTKRAFTLLSQRLNGRFPRTPREAEDEIHRIAEGFSTPSSGGLLPNDFAPPLMELHPEYSLLFSLFKEEGAREWGISGSGSGAFALFGRDAPPWRGMKRIEALDWVRKILLVE
ncbi:4-(cytidine 5'-diphospho)-2-C-methyl-D-erythritol kinase [Aminivibrio sp.]